MIVCDLCKDVSKPAFQCYTAMSKEDERKGKKIERTMIKFPTHLCESCITDFIGRLRKFVSTITKPQ